MPDNDALRRMLGEAESHVLSLVSAPGAEATRVGLRRRARKRAVAAALTVTLAVVGIGLSAWSSDPLPPVDPVPTAQPSDSPIPTVSPSTSPSVEVAAPPSVACTPKYQVTSENTSLQAPGGKVKLLVTPDSQLCSKKITVFWGAYRLQGDTWQLFDTQTYSLDASRRSVTFTVPLLAYCGGARVWFVHGDLKRETSYASNSSPYLTYTPRPESGVIDYSMASPPCPS